MTTVQFDHVRVLDVPVHRLTSDQVVETIMEWTSLPGSRVAVGVNAAVCNLAAEDRTFRTVLMRADLLYPDGQSIVWAARLLGVGLPERIATTDLVNPLAAVSAQRGKRIFLYGSAPGVAARAAARLRASAPGLLIDGHDGYTAPDQMRHVIDQIRAFSPDILFVGLGDPLQQHWIDAHRHQLNVPVILTCGGLFDWTSGDNRRAPRWMLSSGFEWLWRLMLEPGRLASRYLIGNPVFLFRLARQIVRRQAQATRS
ncbi:WecB/TagA/CpsF family glycosyltransferase [Cryobacterium sp. TMT2-14]|uniref:WecB/TagA/CpsF family glycosyltransferase n=1 Tax=Cryobacterium sp. TMT2-14 TaxID=1259245 RepID=UPI00106C2017|nr:WecB/TagA/CpsF family glycosyltransferase [Cryobacterium sp. TMT2-14]TFC36365.1 WecB/TagA/CpsF family glycosyltransferase [Cryobacterium sp. TMT2-14]